MNMVNIADLKDPNDPEGRSYRDVNSAREHNIPVGTLVELEDGVRLWVVHHGRDCDETPLYTLCHDKEGTEPEHKSFNSRKGTGGYSEEALRVVEPWEEWIKTEDKQPNEGQSVIAVGTWQGEICGTGESDFMGIGIWKDQHVAVDTDTYSVNIIDVTRWMPRPEHPVT